MIITGVSYKDLAAALDGVSVMYGGNIIWNRTPESLNKAGTRWRLTLRCISSKRPGHSIRDNPFSGSTRNLVSACWHAHGRFFDALPAGAVIHAGGRVFMAGDPWKDYNIGSQMFPAHASGCCGC